MDKVSYSLGIGIGQQLKQMGATDLNVEKFSSAIKDVLKDNPLQIDHREAQQHVQQYFQQKEQALQAERAVKGEMAKKEGEQFLADNAKKEGVVTTASGLQYSVIREGEGRKPKATDKVRCHYEGFLTDGTVFDSSVQRGEPAVFGLDQVIAGWTEGLQLMAEGAKYRFTIPYRLAYGENGAGQTIPPYATLIFDVELLEVL